MYKSNPTMLAILLVVMTHIYAVHRVQSECNFPHNKGSEKEVPTISADIWNAVKGKSYSYKDPNDSEYSYKVAICAPILEPSVGNDAGAVQTKSDGTSSYNLGRISNADFVEGKGWLMIQYFDGDHYHSVEHCSQGNRSTTIMITCGKDIKEGEIQLTEEVNQKADNCYYLFELFIDIACQQDTPGATTLSAGSIAVIVFLSLVAVYLLFGFLYQRFVKGAQGKEQLPNYTFWKELGNLAADGCNLVFRSDEYSEPRQYRGMSGDNLPGNQDLDRATSDRDDQLLNM